MTSHFVLLGVLVGLIVALELLNAYFELLFNTQKAALEEDIEKGRRGSGAINQVWLGLRVSGSKLVEGMAFVSLYFHELMHAIVQLASGAKPRIVLCKNGGYAESRPWGKSGIYNLAVALGTGLLRGVCGMAPLLGGSAVIYLCVRYLAPLEPGTLGMLGDSVGAASSTGGMLAALGQATWHLLAAIGGAPIGAIVVIVLVALTLGWGLTPSSADFHNAAPHLLAYALAYLSAAAWLPSSGLLIAIGVLGVPVYLFALLKLNRFGIPWLIGGYTMSCGLLGLLALFGALGPAPALGLASGLASLIVVLLLASSLYAVFLIGLFGLAMINKPSRAFVQRKYGTQTGPGVLGSLVRSFDTCTSCKLHFRGKCDGCGRTAAEIRAAEAA
ncbi:hypothetical protein ACNOYE_33200 [Nannocystaceae bacterium ST9]